MNRRIAAWVALFSLADHPGLSPAAARRRLGRFGLEHLIRLATGAAARS
jgi:hypothetical protein